MLRFKADIRSVAFMILTTFTLVVMWMFGFEMSLWLFIPLYIGQLLLAVIVSVMVHNHQHVNMWTNKYLNYFTDYWLTCFYGFPVFAWIPTHMSNHHVNINTEEDYTRTHRISDKNNLITLITYPTLSGMWQQKAVKDFFFATFKRNKSRFYAQAAQVAILVIFTVTAFVINWQKALLFVFIPQQVSLFAVLIFNYVQHVHADEHTKFNNSRNFLGGMLNYLLLNNGYHMAHHLYPKVHWSELPEKHAEVEHKIHPALVENDFGWFLLRVYVLSIFKPKYRSQQMRFEIEEEGPRLAS